MEKSSLISDKIIAKAKQYLGRPYKFGARRGSTSMFDCSSLVQYVYGQYGIRLPRLSRHQSRVGKWVPIHRLKPGDLIYYWSNRTGKGNVGHVSIYIGNGRILHAVPEKGIIISPFKRNDEEFEIYFMRCRRVLPI